MTLSEIVQSWAPFQRASMDTRQLVSERIRQCDGCPMKKQLSVSGIEVRDAPNKSDSVYYCGMCGCPLWTKLSDEDNTCPLNRWKAVAEDSSYY